MRARVAWLLLAALPAIAVPSLPARADAVRGARVFQRCYACHSVMPGETNPSGPTLRDVLGRRAGTLPGFPYSAAMVGAGTRGLVWTPDTLDVYLADPVALVPGTEMAAPGLPDARDRTDVIDYLLTHSGGAR